MFLKLLAAFILIPLVELYLLLQVSRHTGIFTTLLIVILTGVIGSMLARREGTLAWFRFHSALADGRMPSREIQDGLMIVFAGALLLTPGLITDAFGFMLLIPSGRQWVRKWIISRYIHRFEIQVSATGLDDSQADPSQTPQPEPLHRMPRDQFQTIDAESVRHRN